ncbi:hypothetical protein Q604_UNBC09754G0001, partial [human gut metagenome]
NLHDRDNIVKRNEKGTGIAYRSSRSN